MRKNPNALVAIADGTVVDDVGRTLHVRAGLTTWCRSSSELRRSDVAALFGLTVAGDGFPKVVQRSEAVEADYREPETPAFRSKAEAPIEIVLPSFVRSVMTDECWALTRDDGLEAGGFLFAKTPRRWDTSVRLFHATGTANGIRKSDSLKLDSAEWMRAEKWLARNECHDMELLGAWHTHPGSNDGLPSNADLRAFLGALDWSAERGHGSAFSVGLILSADREGSWGSPRIDGWATKREGYSQRPVTEPATVRKAR